ncbi:MAG: choice-of-anchor Q domain-containing protein, partial [Terriglobales bacterium]
NAQTYTGFSAYQTATGQDANSQYADPLYLSLTAPNLEVTPTSPAVNAGTNLGPEVEGTLDFAGNPRVQNGLVYIGAYEE